MVATQTFQLKRAADLYNDPATPPDLFASWIRSNDCHALQQALEALKAFLVGHNVELDAIRFNIIDDPGAGEPELGAIGLSALCSHTK